MCYMYNDNAYKSVPNRLFGVLFYISSDLGIHVCTYTIIVHVRVTYMTCMCIKHHQCPYLHVFYLISSGSTQL